MLPQEKWEPKFVNGNMYHTVVYNIGTDVSRLLGSLCSTACK
jgi:hypothetical protein